MEGPDGWKQLSTVTGSLLQNTRSWILFQQAGAEPSGGMHR